MIIKSPVPDIEIPNTPLTSYVMHRAAELGDKPAIICGTTKQQYTYAQLDDAMRRAAAGFHAYGLRKGDVVGIVSPNVPEYAVAFHGAALIGAISSTVNPTATAEEISRQFLDSSAACIVTIPMFAEKCIDAAKLVPSVRDVFVFGEAVGTKPFASLLEHGNVVPHVDIDPARDLVVLPYSSGTSGIPKGVMLTHRNLVANLCQTTAHEHMVGEDDCVLGVLPFFHIYGMVVIMCGALREGATIVTMPRFDLEQCLGVIQDHRITYANVVPPIILAFAKHPLVDKYDVSSLKAVLSGAAPLGEQLASACANRLGVVVRQGYGLTETSPVTHYAPFDSAQVKYDSVGPAIANTECRIVDSTTEQDVDSGERGELWIRGPQVMQGYLNNTASTDACLTADGWFKTGDVAVVDSDGWFRIVDRVKELIKYKGMQVAPAELEAILLSHPDIADAAVIPVADEDAGEIPKAYVVARQPLSAEEVMAFVAKHVSPYKKVRRVEFVDAIPKSPSGKILRRLLVDRERQALTS